MPLPYQHPYQHQLGATRPLSRPAALSECAAREGIGRFLEIGPGRACGGGRDNRSAEYRRRNLTAQCRHEPPTRSDNDEGVRGC